KEDDERDGALVIDNGSRPNNSPTEEENVAEPASNQKSDLPPATSSEPDSPPARTFWKFAWSKIKDWPVIGSGLETLASQPRIRIWFDTAKLISETRMPQYTIPSLRMRSALEETRIFIGKNSRWQWLLERHSGFLSQISYMGLIGIIWT